MLQKFLLIITLVFCYSVSFSQETTSSIQGLVTEEANQPLAGATVVATHIPTGTVYTTTTRKDGRFNLPGLKIGGPYQITFSFVGFKTEKIENITLLLGQEFAANMKMTPEAKQLEEIKITSNRQERVFNSNRTGSQEVINRKQMDELPTINRSMQDFIKLTPSSSGLGPNQTLSFGGINGLYNNITVDGANFNNVFGLSGVLGGQTNSQPISLDAIEQIQVNIAPYDVRQGGFSGAGINSVTRSGTNQFKGSVYKYFRSPGFQGYNVNTKTLPKPNFTYQQQGITIGGPIIKNKLFFFISGEQEKIEQPATTLVAVKPGETAVPGVTSQAVSDTLDKLKDFLIQKYNYNPGVYQSYNYRVQSSKITARLDWTISNKHSFTLKYNFLKSLKDQPPSNSGAIGSRQPSNTGLPFSGANYTINNNFNIFIAELNSRFSNRISNKLQVGYSALRDFRSSPSNGNFPLVDILNGTGQTYTSFGYEPFTYNNLLNTDIYQFSDILTYFAGKHELTVGTQNYVKSFVNGFSPNYEGLYVFNSLTDFYNSANLGTANARSYSLSYALTPDGSFPFAKVKATELGFFLQDKWKPTMNFTLTYGARFDIPVFQNSFTANPNVINLTFRDGKKYDVGKKPNTSVLISPRLGFNWDVFGNSKTQLRGGIGAFAGPPPFVYISNQASNNGVQFGSFTRTNVAFSPDINAYRPTGGANTSYNLAFTSPDFKYPQVLKTNIAVDQKLPGGIIATLEFVYNKDLHAINFENVNLPSTGTPLAGPDNRLRFSATKINSGSGGATPTNPNITNAILMKDYSKGHSYFFTIQLQKTARNFYASIAYTHGESKSINDGGSIAAATWRDRPSKGDPNSPELGFANFNTPNRVIGQLSYRKEYAKYFATSVGLIFEAAPAGVGSYTYVGDINNAGTGGNSNLIYVPKDKNDIVLVPVNTGGGVITDTRTADIIWNQLNNFINQDPYLSKHRGEIVERNGAVLPYFKRLDLNITQDFMIKNKSVKHTLRLTLDIINVGNFLNRNWGTYKTWATPFNSSQNAASFLKFEGLVNNPADAHNGWPRYSFLYQDAQNQIPYQNSYQDNSSILSRWQGQVGIRYIFN